MLWVLSLKSWLLWVPVVRTAREGTNRWLQVKVPVMIPLLPSSGSKILSPWPLVHPAGKGPQDLPGLCIRRQPDA